jgi:hypothetical protein
VTAPLLECPYCHAKAMSEAEKLRLGPARSVSCLACGQPVSVSWWAMAAFLPFLLAMQAGFVLTSRQLGIVAIPCVAAGLAAMAYLHLWAVPLRRR